jgi:hypothetical protein
MAKSIQSEGAARCGDSQYRTKAIRVAIELFDIPPVLQSRITRNKARQG